MKEKGGPYCIPSRYLGQIMSVQFPAIHFENTHDLNLE